MMARTDANGVTRVSLCSLGTCDHDADTYWLIWPVCYGHNRSIRKLALHGLTPGALSKRWR